MICVSEDLSLSIYIIICINSVLQTSDTPQTNPKLMPVNPEFVNMPMAARIVEHITAQPLGPPPYFPLQCGIAILGG